MTDTIVDCLLIVLAYLSLLQAHIRLPMALDVTSQARKISRPNFCTFRASILTSRNTFLWRIDKRLFSVSKDLSFKMKLSLAVTPCSTVRFLALTVMFCACLVHILALDDQLARKPRGEDRVSTEGTEVGQQSLPYRDRRTVKNNRTPNLADFANRLKDLEER